MTTTSEPPVIDVTAAYMAVRIVLERINPLKEPALYDVLFDLHLSLLHDALELGER